MSRAAHEATVTPCFFESRHPGERDAASLCSRALQIVSTPGRELLVRDSNNFRRSHPAASATASATPAPDRTLITDASQTTSRISSRTSFHNPAPLRPAPSMSSGILACPPLTIATAACRAERAAFSSFVVSGGNGYRGKPRSRRGEPAVVVSFRDMPTRADGTNPCCIGCAMVGPIAIVFGGRRPSLTTAALGCEHAEAGGLTTSRCAGPSRRARRSSRSPASTRMGGAARAAKAARRRRCGRSGSPARR